MADRRSSASRVSCARGLYVGLLTLPCAICLQLQVSPPQYAQQASLRYNPAATTAYGGQHVHDSSRLRQPLISALAPYEDFPSLALKTNRSVGPLPYGLLWASAIYEKAPCLQPVLTSFGKNDLLALESHYDELTPLTSYLSSKEQTDVRRALEVAFLAHHGQKRKSGEAYITHPVQVAGILARTQMDGASVISGLLHDTVEDTCLSFANIEALFGMTVRKIVEGETKVSKLPKMVRAQLDQNSAIAHRHEQASHLRTLDKHDEQAENLRSMFIAMAEDWRIVVVKLADRLHNMRTLQYMPVNKRIRIARETLEIFAPLAHRLGMWQYKTELADLSFKHLFPIEFEELEKYIQAKALDYEEVLDKATYQLDQTFDDDNWLKGCHCEVSVTGRTKSIHSTWKKMQQGDLAVENVKDLVALRIVLNPHSQNAADAGEALTLSEAEEASLCYHVLGKVHGLWTPLPKTLKDYISSPKPNAYRSLHTSVLVGTQPLEVQIRTKSMHQVAEYGAAAHWAYKDGGASLPWLQIIWKWREELDCAHEFMQLVREELLGTRVFVFTEHGKILNLARGATVGDAAQTMQASPATHRALVNGVSAPDAYELLNGDIVAFEQRRVVTAVPLPLTKRAQVLRDASLARHAHAGEASFSPAAPAEPLAVKETAESLAPALWRACTRCLPLPGDRLVGAASVEPLANFAARGGTRGGTVHRADCECVALRRQLAAGRQLMSGTATEAEMRSELENTGRRDCFLIKVVIFTRDYPGILLALSKVVTEETINILSVHSETKAVGSESAFQFTVQVDGSEQLHLLTRSVQQLPDVYSVVRGSMDDLMHDHQLDGFWRHAGPPRS